MWGVRHCLYNISGVQDSGKDKSWELIRIHFVIIFILPILSSFIFCPQLSQPARILPVAMELPV